MVGMMGLAPKDFWNMSPPELFRAFKGFKEFHCPEEKPRMTSDRLKELMELYPD
jgi:hypothetical protein